MRQSLCLLLLMATRTLGDTCTGDDAGLPGVPSFGAYIAQPITEACMSLYNNACPSAAGITAPVVVLDVFLFLNWPSKAFSPQYLTADGKHLNDGARAMFCDASWYTQNFNISVSGKWVFQTSLMHNFCDRGWPVDSSLSLDDALVQLQGRYGERGAHLKTLEAAGALGVTTFYVNYTFVQNDEADICFGVTMPVTYSNTTHYHSKALALTGTSSWLMAAYFGQMQGNPHTIRIPAAPAPSPPPPPSPPTPPPMPPPSNDVVTIAAIAGGASAVAVLIFIVIYAVVRRRKRANATGSVGSPTV